MKEKILIFIFSFIAGVIAFLMSWLCVKFMERSVVFKLNKKLFNKKDWWQKHLEAREGDVAAAMVAEFKLRHAFAGFITAENFETRNGEPNKLTTLTFRNQDTVILAFFSAIPATPMKHYYLTFDLSDYGFDPKKDYETEVLIRGILHHAILERLKRI